MSRLKSTIKNIRCFFERSMDRAWFHAFRDGEALYDASPSSIKAKGYDAHVACSGAVELERDKRTWQQSHDFKSMLWRRTTRRQTAHGFWLVRTQQISSLSSYLLSHEYNSMRLRAGVSALQLWCWVPGGHSNPWGLPRFWKITHTTVMSWSIFLSVYPAPS